MIYTEKSASEGVRVTEPLCTLGLHPILQGDKGDRRVTSSTGFHSCILNDVKDSLKPFGGRQICGDSRLLTLQFSREFRNKKARKVDLDTCHPPVTLVTLQNRVHAQCLSAFCHPGTLFRKNHSN